MQLYANVHVYTNLTSPSLSLPLSLSLFKVFDATNSTKERRQLIIDHCQPHSIKVSTCILV